MRWLSCLDPNHAARPVLLCSSTECAFLLRMCLNQIPAGHVQLQDFPVPGGNFIVGAAPEVQLGSCSQPFLRMELPFQNCRCFVGLGVRCEHQQVPLVSSVSHCLLGSMNKNDMKIIFQKSEGENLDSLNLKQPLHNQ